MPDLASIYADLHRILEPYAAILDAKRNDESELYVDTRHLQKIRSRSSSALFRSIRLV